MKVQCYRCHNNVIPTVKEVYENSGFVGIDVPNTDATVFRPVGTKKYVGACPNCGAQMQNGEADRLNRNADEFAGWMLFIAAGIIGILLLVLLIVAAGTGDAQL